MPGSPVLGLTALLNAAQLPPAAKGALCTAVEATGAVSIAELEMQDWCELPAWSELRAMERRRLLRLLPAAMPAAAAAVLSFD